MNVQTQNNLARTFRSLHQPGNPLVLSNVWDAATATIVAAHPSTKAITTASFAIAATSGVTDNDLSFEGNMAGIRSIANAVHGTGIPLAADMQDGYGDVAESVKALVEAGVVGCNLEDFDNETETLRNVDDATERIRQAVLAARQAGVPDFVVNARTDVLSFDGSIDDAIARGKAYLEAGAVTVYVWGGPKGRGVSREEIGRLVEGLGGMINVKMNLRSGFLNARELAELGVARVSVGPELYRRAMDGFQAALDKMTVGQSF